MAYCEECGRFMSNDEDDICDACFHEEDAYWDDDPDDEWDD